VAAGGVAAAPALGPAGWVARVREAAPDDAVRSAVTALAVEPLKVQGGEAAELRYVAALVPRVEELAVTRRLVECKARLQRMAPVGDMAEEYNRLVGELFALEARKRSLREQAAGGL